MLRAFILFCLLSGNITLANNNKNSDVKLKQLQSRIADLQNNLQKNQGKKQVLDKRLKKSELAISHLTRSLRILADRLSRKKLTLKKLKKQELSQLNLFKKEQKTLTTLIQSAFLMGRQERIKLLFNQQDPEKISRMMVYYDYINQARLRQLTAIKKRIKQLRFVQEKIEKEESKIHKLQQTQLVEKNELNQSQLARKQVVRDISHKLAQGNKALKQLRQDESQLGKLLTGVQKALKEIDYLIPEEQPFTSRKGKISWPSKGRITASFGATRIGNLQWDGIMIAAPEGNNVNAAHGGRVVYADWLRGFGLLIIIDHGQNYLTLYGHNQTIFKETGDWVETNEKISLVGSSGGQDKSGVYFAIRQNGKPVDPIKWCKRPRGKYVG